MPKNDPDFYPRKYNRYLGCRTTKSIERENSFDTNDHPLWYYRMFIDKELRERLVHKMELTRKTCGDAEHNHGKIPLMVIRGGTMPQNFVVMYTRDFRDLLVGGDRAGEVERESPDPADFLEWLRPDVWGEMVPCQNDTLDED